MSREKVMVPAKPLLYFTTVVAVHLVASAMASPSLTCGVYYFQVDHAKAGLHGPSGTSNKTCLMDCARACALAGNCKTFLWDSARRMCTTSAWEVTNGAFTVSGSTHLYRTPDDCRYDRGYQLRLDQESGTLTRCVFLSSVRASHKKAAEGCRDLGGRLYKVNNLELLSIILQFARQRGMTDIVIRVGLALDETTGIWTWSDGQQVQSDDIFVFEDYQPVPGSCGILDMQAGLLNFVACDVPQQYACEIEQVSQI